MMEPRISNRHIDPHHDTSSESFRCCVSHGGGVSLSLSNRVQLGDASWI